MLWAQQNSCVLLTADLDFSAILAATGRNGPSVVQIRSDLLNADAIGPNVLHVVTNLYRELEAGAIVTLDRHRMRIRILPLGA